MDNNNLDPMGDLAKAFNNVSPSLEEEVKRLKEANKKLQTTLNETQRNLEQLKKNVNITCEEMLKILRDGESYGHVEDYTELEKHYAWKDKL
jgi:DNA-directed RNA polymerase specialized sigma subunit|tara:strand:- start:192 stop:467 length:276 start_codon:yes stop_codon:yes gene_type:complete